MVSQIGGKGLEPSFAQSAPGGFSLSDNVYQQLLKERIIWLGGPVQDDNANVLCAQLLMLATRIFTSTSTAPAAL